MNGDKTQIISHDYYSNCMIEAIKFKLRNFKNVKITVVAPWYNEVFCPHFLWSDGEYDYDFGVERRLTGVQILLFRGYIRLRKLGFNKKYKERMRRSHQSREEDKHENHT